MTQQRIPTANLERLFKLLGPGKRLGNQTMLKKVTALSLNDRTDGDPKIKKQAERYLERQGWI